MAPVQWTTGPGANGHYYVLTPSETDWSTAESVAISMGGHLVSINSAAEQAFVESAFLGDSSPVATSPLWIGLTDILHGAGSREYTQWTTGEPVTFTGWNNANEPNDQNGDEDYVAINWHYSFGSSSVRGTWNDTPLAGTTVDYGSTNARALGPYYGIVEIVPEPGTNLILGVGAMLGVVCIRQRRKAARLG